MSTYAKLFSSIVHSTVWGEPLATRVVWVTMMAIADRDGIVEAAVPGLARAANVSIAEVEAAIACFIAADPHSRTPDNEGRRIEKVDGGWRLLNWDKYLLLKSKEEIREKTAERVKRHRAVRRNAVKRDVTLCNEVKQEVTQVTPSSHLTSGSSQLNSDQKQIADVPSAVFAYPKAFEEVWEGCDRKGGKGAAFKAWGKSKPPASLVAPAWKRYVASLEEWRNPQDVSTWLNERGWLNEYVPYAKPGGQPPAKKSESFEERKRREDREAAERLSKIRREQEEIAKQPITVGEKPRWA